MRKLIVFMFMLLGLVGISAYAEENVEPTPTETITEEVVETPYIEFNKEYTYVEEGQGTMVVTFLNETELNVVLTKVDGESRELTINYTLEDKLISFGDEEDLVQFTLDGYNVVPYIPTEDAPIEEIPSEEEDPTIEDMWSTFWAKWEQPILSAITSFIGVIATLFTALRTVLKLNKRIGSLTQDESLLRQKALETLAKGKDELSKATKDLLDTALQMKEEFNAIKQQLLLQQAKLEEEQKALLESFAKQQATIDTLRIALAQLVYKDPNLFSSEQGNTILNSIDDREVAKKSESYLASYVKGV